ncbi:MAG: hypothetical protein WC514_03150, partial [Candidatus Paceibacterota bacterium]
NRFANELTSGTNSSYSSDETAICGITLTVKQSDGTIAELTFVNMLSPAVYTAAATTACPINTLAPYTVALTAPMLWVGTTTVVMQVDTFAGGVQHVDFNAAANHAFLAVTNFDYVANLPAMFTGVYISNKLSS